MKLRCVEVVQAGDLACGNTHEIHITMRDDRASLRTWYVNTHRSFHKGDSAAAVASKLRALADSIEKDDAQCSQLS